MPFDLGNAFAVIGLDTGPMKAGSSVVGSIVDEINGHLSRIGDIAAGVALGESIRGLVRDIEEMPRALFDVEKQFEQFHAGLTGIFQALANEIPPSWDQIQQGIQAATAETRGKVTRLYEDMADAVATHDRQIADAATQRSQALENEQAALQANAERLGQAQATFANKLEGYSATFHDTIDRVNLTFDQGMAALEASHAGTVSKIGQQIGDLAVSYDKQVADIVSKAEGQLGDLAEKHARAMATIDKQIADEDQKFSDANFKRNRSFDESVASATESFQKGLRQGAVDTQQIFEDSAKAIEAINKRLSQQMSDIRQQELDLQRTFSQKMEDLTNKNQGALTAAQQSDLATQRNRLIADNSAREAALANREKQAQSQAGDSVEKVQDDEQKKLAAVTKRMADEQQKYAEQLQKLQVHYDEDTAMAVRSHQEKLDDLATKQALENQQYQDSVAKVAGAEAQKLEEAKGAYDKKLDALGDSLGKEQAAYDTHALALQQRRDEETKRAKDQYDKEVKTATLTYDNEVANYTRSRGEIERRYAESLVRMDEHDENREASFNSRMRKMEERAAEFNKKIEDQATQLTDKYEHIGKTGAELFSAPWIAKANELEKKYQLAFDWKPDDASKNAQEQTANRIKQIDDFLLVMDQRTGVALPKLRQGFFELLAGGVDPVKDGVLNIVATLAALPQGRGNIDAISRAFIELSEGGFGRAQRELRQFGINLATITTDQGVFILNEQHRLNTAMGVTQQMAWDAIIKSVTRTTDAITTNLQGTALQLITTLQTMWVQFQQIAGANLFNATKQAMSDFITFMRQHADMVKDIATTVGNTLGDMATTVFNALKRLGQPDALQSIGDFLASLGKLKDSIVSVVGDIVDAFVGGGRSADIFETLNRFGKIIHDVATDLNAAGPDIASTIKTIADGIGEFIHNVLQWFSDHGDELKTTIGDVFYAITFGVRAFGEYFSTHQTELKLIQDWFGEMVINLAKAIDIMAKFSSGIEDFLQQNGAFIEAIGKLTIFGNEAWVTATINVFKVPLELIGKLSDALGTTVATLGETKDQLMNFANNFIREWGNAVANAFREALRTINAVTSLGLSELPNAVRAVLDKIYGHSIVEDWLASLEVGFAAGMTKVVDAGVEAFSALPRRMQDVLDSVPQAAGGEGTPLPEGLSPAFTNPIRNRRDALEFYASPENQAMNQNPSAPNVNNAFAYLDWSNLANNAYGAPPGVPTQRWLDHLAYGTPLYGTPGYTTPSGTYGGMGGGGTGTGGRGAGAATATTGYMAPADAFAAGNYGAAFQGSRGGMGEPRGGASGGRGDTSYWDTSAGKAFMAQYKTEYDKTLAGQAQAAGKAWLAWGDAMEAEAWRRQWNPTSEEIAADMATRAAADKAHADMIEGMFGGIRGGKGAAQQQGPQLRMPSLLEQRQNQEDLNLPRRPPPLPPEQYPRPGENPKQQGGGDTYNFEKIVVQETAIDFLAEAIKRLQSQLAKSR